MTQILIALHVLFGSFAIAGMSMAWLNRKGGYAHRLGGRTYGIAMGVALLLAVVISMLTANLFLGLIAAFTAYMIATGVRFAAVRARRSQKLDRVMAAMMLLALILMVAYGVILLRAGQTTGGALIVFALVGGRMAVGDFGRLDWPVGRARLVLHLQRMGGASIATLTAVAVVNASDFIHPAIIVWLLPTLVLSPVIAYWTRRTLNGNVTHRPLPSRSGEPDAP